MPVERLLYADLIKCFHMDQVHVFCRLLAFLYSSENDLVQRFQLSSGLWISRPIFIASKLFNNKADRFVII